MKLHVLKAADKRQYIPMEPGTRERLDRQRKIRRDLMERALTADSMLTAQELMRRIREVDTPKFAK